MLISIDGWDYLMSREPDGRFYVWHHVTPADAGYGTEVKVYLPSDYFRSNTVEEFYDDIAGNQSCRPLSSHKQQEIEKLKAQLAEEGWLD